MKSQNNDVQRGAVLDLLRFFAALAVLCFHWFGQINTHEYIYGISPHLSQNLFVRISAYGQMGVDLFFILSGAVIAKSAIGKSAGKFLFLRVRRVYPAYLFALFGTFFITRFYPGAVGHSKTGDLPGNILMLANVVHVPWVDGVYWTLESEWKFYLGIASLLFIVNRKFPLEKKHLNYFAYCWLLVTSILLASPSNGILEYVFMPKIAPLFIAGILLATGTSKSDWYIKMIPYSICMVESATWRAENEATLLDATAHRTYPYIAFLVIIGIYLLMVIVFSNRYLMNRKSAFVTRLGLLSYPIYLTHGTPGVSLLHLFANKGYSNLVGYSVTGLLVMAVSIFITFVVEPRARNVLNRIAKGVTVSATS